MIRVWSCRARTLIVLAGALAVVAAFLPDPNSRSVAALLCLAQLAAFGVLVRCASQRDVDPDAVWGWWATAVGVLTLGPLLTLLSTDTPWVTGLSVLLAAPFMYQAVVRWNRFRTYVSDPGDWLNGVSAVFAFIAAGLLWDGWVAYLPEAWPLWKVHVWLAILASVVVLLGTAGVVAVIGGLLRDVRMWIVLAVFAGVIVVSLTLHSVVPSYLHAQAGWTGACLAIALASTLRGHSVPRPATSHAPAAGALLVLTVAVAVLVVAGPPFTGRGATVYATLAVLGVSVRVVHLVRELGDLTSSRRQAHTDDLTGIGNRRALLAEVDDLARSRRGAALLLLDIDHFKEVNDRHGHQAGDDLLRRVARTTVAALPRDALLTRLGGDEFAALLPGRDELAAAHIARTVHEAVATEVEIGLSVGVRAVPAGQLHVDRVLHEADLAMYTAKTGGGGISVYDREVDARRREATELREELRHLLTAGTDRRRDQLVLHYQPQIDVASGRVAGVEALVRWRHPDRGPLPPMSFLDLVQDLGMMPLLTHHVLNCAVEDGLSWRCAGIPLRISVNLSATCLTDPGLLTRVDDVLRHSGLDPDRLVLEVTETTLMADPGQALAVAHSLTRRGVRLSIDDFGTGYSSLAYLTDLPASEVKLDRAFTTRLLAEPRTAEIVGATVGLGHRLGMRVIAEGVEDEATLALLEAMEVDESQGYLHAKPLPPAEFVRWLAERSQVVGALPREV